MGGHSVVATRVRETHYDAILIVRIPNDLRERCARQAYLRGLSLSGAVREAILAWMDEDEMEGEIADARVE